MPTPVPAPVLFTLENIKSVFEWQQAGFVHPLTCGNDSQHLDLLPAPGEILPIQSGEAAQVTMVLVCVQCGYRQKFIPECCIIGPRDPGWQKMKDALSGKTPS